MRLDTCQVQDERGHACGQYASWSTLLTLPGWPRPERRLVCSGCIGRVERAAQEAGGKAESRQMALASSATSTRTSEPKAREPRKPWRKAG